MPKKTNTLLLFKTLSERLDKNGKRYVDYYLASKQDEVVKLIRVYCVFLIDKSRFNKLAINVESLDEVSKYFLM